MVDDATYRLTVEYDGSAWHGWQIQPDRSTVQAALESALSVVLRTRISVVGSGRTDSGVHARGQVAHFQTGLIPDPIRVQKQVNGLLPDTVCVRDLEHTRDGFHARFDARQRTYRYQIATRKVVLERSTRPAWYYVPDVAAMNRAAASLVGEHECSAFCRTASATTNRVCRISAALWHEQDGSLDFIISADRFLHGMVRAIVGTLLEIGRGKRPETDIVRVLASRDRREAGPAAPAHGLILERVDYE